MTAKSEILDKIRRCFSIWSSDLKLSSRVNRLSEDIAAGLLNLIYGCNLQNANRIHPNYMAIDLVDPDAEDGIGVAVRITTSNTRQKALRTMKMFCDTSTGYPLCDEYGKLIILILTVDDKFLNWEKLVAEDYSLSIINLVDLSNTMELLEFGRLEQILEYLNRNLQLDVLINDNPRNRISRIAHIIDAETLAATASEMTESDVDRFYMVDPNFHLMLRIVSNGRDILHQQMNDRLLELCSSGSPTILTGYSGTGKSTIMLRAAVSWVRNGGIALWLSWDENLTLNDDEASQFYRDILTLIPPGRQALLCLDNPSLWSSAFAALGWQWPGDPRLQLLLTERSNRLARITDANGDLLRFWFDNATVVALMPQNERRPLRVKNYTVEYIPEFYLRKQRILEKSVEVMFRQGIVQRVSIKDAVKRIMKDYNRNTVSLTELIYQAQFWLRGFATSSNIRMDWDEWKSILRKELGIKKSAQQLYGVIALCKTLDVPVSVSLFCRFFDIEQSSISSGLDLYRSTKK